MEGEPSTGGESTRDHILRGNQGFLFPEPLSLNGSSVRGGTCEPFLPQHWKIDCFGYMQTTAALAVRS